MTPQTRRLRLAAPVLLLAALSAASAVAQTAPAAPDPRIPDDTPITLAAFEVTTDWRRLHGVERRRRPRRHAAQGNPVGDQRAHRRVSRGHLRHFLRFRRGVGATALGALLHAGEVPMAGVVEPHLQTTPPPVRDLLAFVPELQSYDLLVAQEVVA